VFDVQCGGTFRLAVPLVSSHSIHRTIHALHTPALSSWHAQRIGRLIIVYWMQSHCGCVFLFPTYFDLVLLVVPTRMRVMEPSKNGLYLLSPATPLEGTPVVDTSAVVDNSVAMITLYDHVMWHRRYGHLSMQSLYAQHDHGVPSIPALPGYI
jgi:hypothetical protein